MTKEQQKDKIIEIVKKAIMDFNRILKCYARNDGEMYKVLRWLKQTRI